MPDDDDLDMEDWLELTDALAQAFADDCEDCALFDHNRRKWFLWDGGSDGSPSISGPNERMLD
jgi:hypothetical protein